MKLTNSVWWLWLLAIIEGISWVILALVAVPMKYAADNPVLVKIMGPIHGLLFTLFGLALVMAWAKKSWPFGRVVWIFLLSLVPFGWLVADRWIRKEI